MARANEEIFMPTTDQPGPISEVRPRAFLDRTLARLQSFGRMGLVPVMLSVVAGAAACGGKAGAASRWVAEVDTVGDTIVVRTLSGGVWGRPAELQAEVSIGEMEGDDQYLLGQVSGLAVDADGNMYIYDGQVPALRKYSPDGRYLMTIGRQGGGPGEYKNSDGGLAILADGRLVLRDPGNGRFQLWTLDGEPAGEWRYRGGFFTSTPMFVDRDGFAYSTTVTFDGKPPWKTQLVKYSPAGEPLDTVPVPDWDYEPPEIVAQQMEKGKVTGTMSNSVPFSPTEEWTLSPLGYFVGGVGTRYAIELQKPEGTLRIERVREPVPVDADEKSNAEDVAIDNMQGMVPGWRWNGPSIPDSKPPFVDLLAAADGRIWVRLSEPGERIPADELNTPQKGPDGKPRAQKLWREPVAFDVYEPDGRYVGLVMSPRGFSMHPAPVIRGDTVWAIVRDELDVQRLTRLRVTFPEPPDR
jgi:6-bladed beta-propeller